MEKPRKGKESETLENGEELVRVSNEYAIQKKYTMFGPKSIAPGGYCM